MSLKNMARTPRYTQSNNTSNFTSKVTSPISTPRNFLSSICNQVKIQVEINNNLRRKTLQTISKRRKTEKKQQAFKRCLDQKEIIQKTEQKKTQKNQKSQLTIKEKIQKISGYSRSTNANNVIKLRPKDIFKLFEFKKRTEFPLKQKSKIGVLTQCLSSYFSQCAFMDMERDINQISHFHQFLLAYLTPQSHKNIDLSNFNRKQWNPDIVKSFRSNLTKLLYHICRQIHQYKEIFRNIEVLIKINKDIQYFSRLLKFNSLTLKCCFQIGELYLCGGSILIASDYYLKCLKFAVYLNDKYLEQKAIDKIGLCHYYQGKSSEAHFYHFNCNKLSDYDRGAFKQLYNSEDQIEQLFNDKYNSKQKINQRVIQQQNEITFDQEQIKKNTPQANGIELISSLNKMKKMTEFKLQVPKIVNAYQKVKNVGMNQYYGNSYLSPKVSKFKNKQNENDQVLLTHRSLNRYNIEYERKKYLRNCKQAFELINYLTNAFLNKFIQD